MTALPTFQKSQSYGADDDVREIFLGFFLPNKKGVFVKFFWDFFRPYVTNFSLG